MAESRKKTTTSGKPKPASRPSAAEKKAAAGAKAADTKQESGGKPTTSRKATTPPEPDVTSPPKSTADKKPEQASYEVVSPPTPIDRSHKGGGLVGILLSLVVVILLAGAAYITWPSWSPYVADRFPMLEYQSAPDPLLTKLTDRVNALEAEAHGRSNAEKTIAEMEKERTRLHNSVKSLLARLDELEGAVGNVKQMIAATGASTDSEQARQSFERISERLAELEKRNDEVVVLTQRMSNMESAGATGAGQAIKQAEVVNQRLNEAVSSIENRLTEFETKRAQPTAEPTGAPASATVLAISQLRKTILSGQPFTRELEAVQAVSGNDHGMKAALLVLEKHAASGVATLADLREQFSQAAGAIVAAASKSEGHGWFEIATNRLRSFIAIRQVDGGAPKDSVDAYVLRAEDSLKAGDLEGAVKTLGGLGDVSPQSANAASHWLGAARARLLSERAVSSLHVYAVSLIAATKE